MSPLFLVRRHNATTHDVACMFVPPEFPGLMDDCTYFFFAEAERLTSFLLKYLLAGI